MKKIISIDYDGTIVKQTASIDDTNFELLPNAKEVIQWIHENFYTILWTCRDGLYLQSAVDFLSLQGLQFHSINQNIPGLSFKTSAKVYADCYLDNNNYGADIDWLEIKNCLTKKFLTKTDEDLIGDVVIAVIGE